MINRNLYKSGPRSLTILLLLAGLILFFPACNTDTEKYVDEITLVREKLDQERAAAIEELQQNVTARNIEKLIDLGDWENARAFIERMDEGSAERKYVTAKLQMKTHQYEKAETLVNQILSSSPSNRDAKLLKAELEIQAWRLDEADRIASGLLSENKNDARAGLIRGKVAQLQRNYDEALRWAKDIQNWDPDFADGYLLEAESIFWDQDPEGAEPALKKAIEKNPFNPDARYSYGYAVWRRVDATQLENMAAQWNLALEINPLHYLTHWHYGNGHTNLTYANYAQPEDEEVREKLKAADPLVSQNKMEQAIRITRDVEKEYPQSVLPAMMRGSLFYLYYDMEREARLDSAQTLFDTVLQRKKNYGPAHNAMAAVIKQRQFSYLDEFEELESAIENTEIPKQGDVFYNVFRDSRYYPGDRVYKMISQQIGPSRAYLEMINKFDSNFAIPPLHIDLAIAMNRSFFRTSTTFDNRQWMDIRGVGSGATGIEYLERGSHLERNVLAHEYAHLYHGSILTDRENRKIRSLYYQAMARGGALDYYASNNESEYFAQGYAGFLSEKKVHPLNHKSMNTNEYIKDEDPDLYDFLDSLIQKQEAYLAGDKKALADNWAQTYVSLARRAGAGNEQQAVGHLNNALTYNKEYLPAILEFTRVYSVTGDFNKARAQIAKAKEIDEDFAPIYSSEADILHREALAGKLTFEEAFERQSDLFEKAKGLEGDYSILATLNSVSRSRFYDYGHLAEAIRIGRDYADNGPTISTYLRDRRNDAESFVNNLRSQIGYTDEVLPFFRNLSAQNPQNFGYRQTYADVLLRAGDLNEALNVLEEGQRILSSAGNSLPGYSVRIALIHVENGDQTKAEAALNELTDSRLNLSESLIHARVLGKLGNTDRSFEVLKGLNNIVLPIDIAEAAFVNGELEELRANRDVAQKAYEEALKANPYHLGARLNLKNLLEAAGKADEAEKLVKDGDALEIPLGPDFKRKI